MFSEKGSSLSVTPISGLRTAGKDSPRRQELRELSGATTVPYLVDPNRGVAMGESLDIVRYLFDAYAPPAAP